MGRSPCCDKFGLKRGPWTPEEDQKLVEYIRNHGHRSWRTLPTNAGLSRCGKSCRLRWTNYLRPDIKRGKFSFEEEDTIIQLHSVLGNKWSAIAARLPGRTDNEIKNYWNTHIRKKLLRMGIDPVTHAPRLDLLDLSSLLHPALLNPTQLDLSRFLCSEPFSSTQLLSLATTLLSAQQRQQTNQNLQQLLHGQSQSFQVPQQQQQQQQQRREVHHPVLDQLPSCTTSNAQIQANASEFQPVNTQHSQWESDTMIPSNFSGNFAPLPDNDCFNLDHQFVVDPSPRNSTLNSYSDQTLNYPSVFPATSPTHVNTSSTYITGSSAEDEGNSFCSNCFDFQIPELLDVSGFM